jgi:hypothetical protein
MTSIWLVLFAITVGFTASGVVANLYRVLGFKGDSDAGRIGRAMVMIVAGPTVVFESAVRGMMRKEWPRWLFWLVVAGLAYWSLALGLFVLDIVIHV